MAGEDVVTLLLFLPLMHVTEGAPCGSSILGHNNALSKNQQNDYASGSQFLLTDIEFESDCCGVVESWHIFSGGTGAIYFEVWRPAGGGSYTLMGQNAETVSSSGSLTFSIATANKIQIEAGDVVGWYTPGTDIVQHKNEGNSDDNNYVITGTTISSLGDTVTFSNRVTDRFYAFYATLGPGARPVISNLDNSISQAWPAFSTSTSIYTVAATDSDIGDTVTLSLVSVSPSNHFNFDTTTGDITPNTASLTIGTYTIVIRATDYCGQTDDGTLTVDVTNTAPVISTWITL